MSLCKVTQISKLFNQLTHVTPCTEAARGLCEGYFELIFTEVTNMGKREVWVRSTSVVPNCNKGLVTQC